MIENYLAKIRHAEYLAEAERNRLLALGKNKHSGNSSSSARFLVYIGRSLRRLGSQIEERFEAETSINQPRVVDRG